MTVSRTLSFIVGLALAGMAAFAALGEEIPTGKTDYYHAGEVPCANCAYEQVSARLDRIEKLLLEMCERTARFGGCEELRKQR